MDPNAPDADDELRPEYNLDELRPVVGRGRLAATGDSTKDAFPGPNPATDLWIATSCGAIPLAVGSLIFITFYFTRGDSLPGLGWLTVSLGCVFFVIGCIHLVRYWNSPLSQTNATRWQRDLRGFLVASLLLVNFPAAGFYAVMAVALMSQLYVVISNDSSHDIDELTFSGPRTTKKIGPISAGDSEFVGLNFRGDGNLTFIARQGDRTLEGEVMGYVTGGIGGEVTLIIQPDGKFGVKLAVDEFVD